MRHVRYALASVAVLALLAAACGDGDTTATPTGESPIGGTPTDETPAPDGGTTLMGADGLLSDTFVRLGETEGMYLSGPARAQSADYDTFVQSYEDKFGERPIQAFHAHAYDAANMLFDAIEQVAEEDGDSLSIDRQALRDALYATAGMQGLTGTITCNVFGDCAAPRIGVYQNQDPSAGIFATIGNVVFTSSPQVTGQVPADPPAGISGQDLGAITIGAGEPVRIATLQAISGPVANLGEDQVRAVEVAIDDRGGELLGHPIELQSEDDLCSAEGGQTGAQRIVSDPQIVGTVGTSCSGAAVPASQVISEAGGVMISGSNTSPSLTATGYLDEGTLEPAENFSPGYYRTAHNDEFQGHGAAQFAFEELGARTAATIHDGDPYTDGLTTQFGIFFEEFGGEVVLATAINKGDTDMRPVLTDVAAEAPDVVFFPIFQPEADFIVQQVQEFPELLGESG